MMYCTDFTPYKLTQFTNDFFEIDIWDKICQNPEAIDIIKKKMSQDHTMINIEFLLQNENVYQLFMEEGNILNDFILRKEGLPEACVNELNFYLSEQNENLVWNISRHSSEEAIRYFKIQAPYLLNHHYLSENHHALEYLKDYLNDINWSQLSLNPNAITLLKDNLDKVDWAELSLNPNALELIQENYHLVNWDNLSANPGAIHILEKNPHLINWKKLSKNPEAIHLLEFNIDKVDWCSLSGNSNAVGLLDKYFIEHKIYRYLYKMPNIKSFRCLIEKYYYLIQPLFKLEFFEIPVLTFFIEREKTNFLNMYIKSQLNQNSKFIELNPRAIYFIEHHLDFIDYFNLCKNPNAIHLIENKSSLDMCLLSRQPRAITVLEKREKNINWKNLSFNIEASHLMESNLNKIDWDNIASNIGAIKLIENNLHRISKLGWKILSKNPKAISILEKNTHNIDWNSLSFNPQAIELLKKNTHRINWANLCRNPKGIPIIENNLGKLDDICWRALSSNPEAIHLLKENPQKINWRHLIMNPKATQILESEIVNQNPSVIRNISSTAYHQSNIYLLKYISSFFYKFSYIGELFPVNKILDDVFDIICSYPHALEWISNNRQFLKWFKNRSKHLRFTDFYLGTLQRNMSFLRNPSIFEIDYKTLEQRIQPFKEELIQKCFHPKRLFYYLENYGYDIGDDNYTQF